uniref:Uncharacterized protein n=1 Tax=viral metagenome TaxID=1070528 RepID=A0A6C0C8J2_9ZZZZ
MSLVKIVIIIAVIIFFLYMMKGNRVSTDYVIPQNVPAKNNVLIETLMEQTLMEQTAPAEFAPYTSQPNDSRYVLVPNLGVYLLPYEYLNLSIPYHQWMYSHFPSYYGEYYDNYWPFDNSVGGAKYINSFNNSHWNRRQGNRQNRQDAGHYWDRVGSNSDDINGNRWSSFNRNESRGRCRQEM